MDSLQRFLDGQRFGFESALAEMKAGEKRTHWIWYIFPQLRGLGHSYNSQFYGIADIDEAKAYLDHPVLGARLRVITLAVLSHSDKDIEEIMSTRIDAKKFKSSMTLFDVVSPNDIFARALDTFYGGSRSRRTLAMLNK